MLTYRKKFLSLFSKLKLNCQFIIDDISWPPYLRDSKRNNFNCELNNSKTFTKVLEINYANFEKIKVYSSFIGSGSARMIKKSNDQ